MLPDTVAEVQLAAVVCANSGKGGWTDRYTHASRRQPAKHLWLPAVGDAVAERVAQLMQGHRAT